MLNGVGIGPSLCVRERAADGGIVLDNKSNREQLLLSVPNPLRWCAETVDCSSHPSRGDATVPYRLACFLLVLGFFSCRRGTRGRGPAKALRHQQRRRRRDRHRRGDQQADRPHRGRPAPARHRRARRPGRHLRHHRGHGRDKPGELVWIDPLTDKVTRRMDIGPEPNQLAVTPDGKFAYVPVKRRLLRGHRPGEGQDRRAHLHRRPAAQHPLLGRRQAHVPRPDGRAQEGDRRRVGHAQAGRRDSLQQRGPADRADARTRNGCTPRWTAWSASRWRTWRARR